MKAWVREIRGGAFAAAVLLLASGASAATVAVDSDCAGMGEVESSETRLQDGSSRLKLRATAADGFAFAGWSVAENDVIAWSEDPRYPGSLTATVVSNAEIMATFTAGADDCLSFDIADIFPEEVDCGEAISGELQVDSASFPTVTFRNLPHGLAFDERTLTVFGRPDEPGLYRIAADAVNGSGFSFRSCCTLCVRNVESQRVAGTDTEIPVDEYFYSEIGGGDFSDMFSFAEEPTAVTLSGTVPGLVWNDEWQLLYGTPTDVGEYTLKLKAEFPTGSVETATLTLTVCGADPDEYDLDLGVLDNLQVGDTLDESDLIGADSKEAAIKRVSGLPGGLSAAWLRDEDGVRCWYVSGTVRDPGFHTVLVQLEDRSDGTQRVAKVARTIAVADVQDVYVSATSSDPSLGTVSGGGAVSPLEDVTLTAKPRTGCVFAGWCDADGERLVLQEGVDYRTPSVVLAAGGDFMLLSPVAHFVERSEDVAPDLSELDGSEFSFASDEFFEEEFAVESLSLPTLVFKNLPKGVTCSATGDGGFALTYDPSKAAASGRYAVTVTATNASGERSSATFRIIVGNRTDSRINVDDDYGEFTPGEEIDPIDLSGAVDFDRGETLSVSGLPRGLAYNAKANEKKKIDAHTITGTPTAPGEYTLTFSAKVVSGATTNKSGKVSYKYETAKATAFLTVLPYPALEIEVDDDAAAAGCKVTGAGNYKAGTKVTLKATAAKGWVFAGWGWLDDVEGLAALNPKLSYVTGEDDISAQAEFVPVSDDGLTVYAPEPTTAGFAAEWPLKESLGDGDVTLIADLIETVSWPTVKVAGLPGGVKFSSSDFLLSGAPTKSGVYHVTVTAKNAGGYSFVRVFDLAVLNGDGTLPTESPLANAAEIDFTPLESLTTGVHCPTGSTVLAVGPKPGSGSAVKKVAVSDLPAGLKASVALADGAASAEITGTPSKPGRFTVSVSVAYADGKSLKSRAAVVVEDGGSGYLFVSSGDSDAGTVAGEGVYASGATVKLTARPKSKQVFAGWLAVDEHGEYGLFAPLRELDGVDPRTASVAFPFRPGDFNGACKLEGAFLASSDDYASVIEIESDVWEIDPGEPSTFAFAVDSQSVPKVSVTGLPKGVSVDSVRGVLTYAPTSSATPGIYTATVSAKNVSQKRASTRSFEVRVANRVSEAIDGLDPDMDAYAVSVGTTLDPTLITPTAGEGWTLSAKGLPSGLSFKNGAVTGVPAKAGDYTVTFTATTGSGKSRQTETATVTLRVAALPASLCGTFTGVLSDPSAESGSGIAGTVVVTATTAGKISVVAKTPAKTCKFTAKAWDAFRDDAATLDLQNKDGSHLQLTVVATSDWRSWQASGTLAIGEDSLSLAAQRNPFGAKDGDSEARSLVAAIARKSTLDGWNVRIATTGAVTFSGKYDGKSYSGSTVLQIEDGMMFARYVKFIDKKQLLILTFGFDESGYAATWTAEKR